MNPRVQILMSAYNGAAYIEEQINTILHQEDVEIFLLIRDDGSTDNTLSIIDTVTNKYPQQIRWYQGENLGPAGSFFDLLLKADDHMDYYAFSDQDDFWLPDKIRRAILCLKQLEAQGQNRALYAGQVIYASKDLTDLKPYAYRIEKGPSFGNALVENICIGCTEVFTRGLREFAVQRMPSTKVWHDWWLYLLASYSGEVYYDDEAHIYYRQHENNQVGMKNTWKERWIRRMKRFSSLRGTVTGQASEFCRVFEEKNDRRKLAQLIAGSRTSLAKRLKLITNKEICRQHVADDLVYRILFLFGLL